MLSLSGLRLWWLLDLYLRLRWRPLLGHHHLNASANTLVLVERILLRFLLLCKLKIGRFDIIDLLLLGVHLILEPLLELNPLLLNSLFLPFFLFFLEPQLVLFLTFLFFHLLLQGILEFKLLLTLPVLILVQILICPKIVVVRLLQAPVLG